MRDNDRIRGLKSQTNKRDLRDRVVILPRRIDLKREERWA